MIEIMQMRCDGYYNAHTQTNIDVIYINDAYFNNAKMNYTPLSFCEPNLCLFIIIDHFDMLRVSTSIDGIMQTMMT